jgi:hypothetical protein
MVSILNRFRRPKSALASLRRSVNSIVPAGKYIYSESNGPFHSYTGVFGLVKNIGHTLYDKLKSTLEEKRTGVDYMSNRQAKKLVARSKLMHLLETMQSMVDKKNNPEDHTTMQNLMGVLKGKDFVERHTAKDISNKLDEIAEKHNISDISVDIKAKENLISYLEKNRESTKNKYNDTLALRNTNHKIKYQLMHLDRDIRSYDKQINPLKAELEKLKRMAMG